MINQAPIVRYTASVSEKFFPNFGERLFQQNRLLCLIHIPTYTTCYNFRWSVYFFVFLYSLTILSYGK
jgi:hypothetical protein